MLGIDLSKFSVSSYLHIDYPGNYIVLTRSMFNMYKWGTRLGEGRQCSHQGQVSSHLLESDGL